MNRPIKFRAFADGKMHEVRAISFTEAGDVHRILDSEGVQRVPEALLQFTGLRDKNGKEIYEGNVVRWDDQSGGKYWRVAQVYYDDFGRLCYEFLPSTTTKQLIGDIWYQGNFAYAEETDKELEVIGDIYQNPELIR